jgi:predicted molibdopterin-dependent oxidoreductase YjgC
MGFTPSVCPYCSCGCGILLQTRGGRLIGTHPGVRHSSSKGSLCMRGWNAVDAPTHHDRLTTALVREKGQLVQASAKKALKAIAQWMEGLRAKGASSVLFCLGPTCANEDAYAIKKLARELKARVCPTDLAGFPAARHAIRKVFGRGYLPGGLDNVANADVVWIFGADPKACPQVASRLFAAMQHGAKVVQFDLFTAAVNGSRRTPVAIPPEHFGLLPLLLQKASLEADRIPAIVKAAPSFNALAEAWRPGKAPALPEHPWLPDAQLKELVAAFLRAKNPAVIIGERFLSAVGAGEATIQLLQALVLLGAGERIVLMTGEVNSWGTWDILSPEKEDTDALLDLLDPVGTRMFDAVFIVGDDLMRRTANQALLAKRLGKTGLVVVIDRFHSEMENCAQVVLPSVTFAERDGTATNMFGVVQRWQAAVEPLGESIAEREWIAQIGQQLGVKGWPASESEWFAAMRKDTTAYKTKALDRLYAETHAAEAVLEESTTLAFSPPKVAVRREGPKEFPLRWYHGSHPAIWSTGAISERDEILRREVNQSNLHMSPVDLVTFELRAGSPVKVITEKAQATMTVQEDKRLPAGVLLAIPLPGSTARALSGFFPEADCQTVGTQPVPVRLEKI